MNAPHPLANAWAPDPGQAIVDDLHVGVCVVRYDRFLYVNRRLADMLGLDAEDMVRTMAAHEILHPDDRPRVLERLLRRNQGEATEPCDVRIVGPRGVLEARVHARRIRFAGQAADLTTLTDITEVKQALRIADRRAQMLALSEELCLGGSIVVDLPRFRAEVSSGLLDLVHSPDTPSSLGRRSLLRWIHPADRRPVWRAWRDAAPGQAFELRHRIVNSLGVERHVLLRGLLEGTSPSEASRAIAVVHDVTAQSWAERQLHEARTTDSVTGLANRIGLLDRLDEALAPVSGAPSNVVLLLVDVPQVCQVKQGLGIEASDDLMVALAGRLWAAFQAMGTVARVGESEFALLIPGAATDLDDLASDVLRLLRDTLSAPEMIGDSEVHATHSIGVAFGPADAATGRDLLVVGLRAMRAAAEEGRGRVRFASVETSAPAMRRISIEWALQQALANDEFRLVFQPQVELEGGRIAGAEALLRWKSPSLGDVSPSEFVPVAERSGHIVQIGTWVLRATCLQLAAWRRSGLAAPRIHVNVSAAQLAQGDLAERMQAILVETGVDAKLLGIEITESMLTGDTVAAARTLGALRSLGVEISLDDFGTGYSNLGTLRSLPIDWIKIDRSYVADVLAAPAQVSMTRAVINMAHSLQMRVLAEGVEDEGQLLQLLAQRCDSIQGFHFSEPVDADQFAAMVREDRRLPAQLFDKARKSRTVLLVDDEENILASLKRSLRRGGYRILTAANGAEGLEKLMQADVDVIISDQRMPGMTGVEFLRQAKALYPDTVRIVLSGYTELQSITDAINEGAIYKFLTKPWEDDLLRANIEEAFRQKEMADENRRLEREVRTANAELATANQRLQSALASQQDQLAIVEDRSRATLDVLNATPVALVGLDADDVVVFVNASAQALVPDLSTAIGCCIGDAVPERLRPMFEPASHAGREAVIGDRRYQFASRTIDGHGFPRGRIVAIVPATGPHPP